MGARHRNNAGISDGLAFKALVNRKAEHKGITLGKAAAHLRDVLNDTRIDRNQVLLGVTVRIGRRTLAKLGDVIRPIVLGRSAQLGNRLDTIANLRSGILINGAFDHSLVVIDEQARRREFPRALFALIELDCGADAVRGAASELSLVVDRRALRAQIDRRRQALRKADQRRPVHKNCYPSSTTLLSDGDPMRRTRIASLPIRPRPT